MTLCWRKPDSNHRSLSYDRYPSARALCARSAETRAHPEMLGGAVILTIDWLDGDHRHARALCRAVGLELSFFEAAYTTSVSPADLGTAQPE